MYDSFDAFQNAALACGATYYSDLSLQPQKIDAAYKIYQNAKNGTKLLDADGNPLEFGVSIVGRLALKVKSAKENGKEEYIWLPADESFPSIDQIMKENLGTLNEESDQTGSILEAKNWSLLEEVQPMDSVKHIQKPQAVGKAITEHKVKDSHFANFL